MPYLVVHQGGKKVKNRNLIDLKFTFRKRQSLNTWSSALMNDVISGFSEDDYLHVCSLLRSLFIHLTTLKAHIPETKKYLRARSYDRGAVNSYRYAFDFWSHAMQRLGQEDPADGAVLAMGLLSHIFRTGNLYKDFKLAVFGAMINTAEKGVEDKPALLPDVMDAVEKVLMNTVFHCEDDAMRDLFNKAGRTWRGLIVKADANVRNQSRKELHCFVFTREKRLRDESLDRLAELLDSVRHYGHPALAGEEGSSLRGLRLVVSNSVPV